MQTLLASLLIGLLSALPQATPPDTPAARQFSAWLEAFNTGDAATIRQYYEKNNPSRVANLDRVMQFRENTGGFDFQKSLDSTPTKFTALVKERKSDQFAHAIMEVQPDPPYQIVDINLEAIPTPSELAPKRFAAAELPGALRAKLDADAASGAFSGAVLVAKDGASVFAAAYGLADRDKKIPNKLDTCFRLGSMNKMFTATSILQLVQAGKIQLTDPLGKYLKDYPNADVASKVTIHMLLTHTGGTGDFFGPEFDAHRLELKTLQDYITLLGKRAPEFEPGSKYEYSNFGFIILGRVVESVSGENYYDYVQKHIFQPAGMTSTASLPEAEISSTCAVGYMTPENGGALRSNVDTLPYRGTSAGGGYSTVTDLLRFATALDGHKLLDAQHTELLTAGKVAAGPETKYAYGFGERIVDGVRSYGHGGGAPGMNGVLTIFPEKDYVIAVLANLDPPAATRIGDYISNRLPN